MGEIELADDVVKFAACVAVQQDFVVSQSER